MPVVTVMMAVIVRVVVTLMVMPMVVVVRLLVVATHAGMLPAPGSHSKRSRMPVRVRVRPGAILVPRVRPATVLTRLRNVTFLPQESILLA